MTLFLFTCDVGLVCVGPYTCERGCGWGCKWACFPISWGDGVCTGGVVVGAGPCGGCDCTPGAGVCGGACPPAGPPGGIPAADCPIDCKPPSGGGPLPPGTPTLPPPPPTWPPGWVP